MKPLLSAAACLALASASTTTFAAEAFGRVDARSGVILLDRGEGFGPVKTGAALRPGDRLLVKKGGSVVFADGCRLKLAPGATVRLDAARPCAARARLAQPGATEGPGPAGPELGLSTGAKVALFLTGAVVTSAVLGDQVSDNDKPASR